MDSTKNKVNSDLKQFISQVSRVINLERVILFGSRARGEESLRSDIDLIVISKDFAGKRSFERPGELYRLWWDRADKTEIDIICLTPEEFEIMRKRVGVIQDASKEGVDVS